jgi:hypothetical protein
MSLRAIFRFENLDSTRDLNDRFRGIFNKGIYEGGEVKASATGTSAIVSPFKALTYDGMAVESDEEIVVPVDVNNNNVFIVLNAYYVIGSAPIIKVELVPESQINSNENYVRLAKKVSATSYNYTDEGCVDKISPVGRNHYRGALSSEEFATIQDSFSIKDWCFVTSSESTTIQLKISEGNFAIYKATNLIEDEVNAHIQNDIENADGYDSSMGGAGELKGRPTIEQVPLQVLDSDNLPRPCNIGEESYGSFNITSDKWFAIDSIRNNWKQPKDSETHQRIEGSNYEKTEYASNGKLGTFIDEYFVGGTSGSSSGQEHTRGVRFYDANNVQNWYMLLGINLPEQTPSVNVRHITENYPLLPTLDEKYALVGNFLDETIKPSKDNRFVTQLTPGYKIVKAIKTGINISEEIDVGGVIESHSWEELNIPTNVNVYAGSASSYESYFKCIITKMEGNAATPNNFKIQVREGNVFRDLSSSDFVTEGPLAGKGYLKQGLSFWLYDWNSDSTFDGVFYIVATNIDEMTPPVINTDTTVSNPVETNQLVLERKSGGNNYLACLTINNDEELVLKKSNGDTYKVMLIKDA